jgi:hypothetical protein
MQTYKLLEQDTVLLSQPELIKKFGRVGAQFIHQLHYWEVKQAGILHDGAQWIYNTADAWAEQLQISVRQIRRIIKNLREAGVILIKKLSTHKSNRTNYYSLNYDFLNGFSEKNNTQTVSSTHRDILSSSLGHKGTMVIQRITNKDFNNKSEGEERIIPLEGCPVSENLIEQVPIIKNLRIREGQGACKTPTTQVNTTVQDMIGLWNKTFDKTPTKLSKDLARNLMGAFKHKFDQSLDKWQHYCHLIASSDYMMGESFTLTLSWALKFATIDRILAKDLGVKDIPFKPSEASLEQKALDHIQNISEPETCKKARRLILKALGTPAYVSWFTQVDFTETGQGEVGMRPHNTFVQDAIQTKFAAILVKTFTCRAPQRV